MKPRLISGIQPTGQLHLGNYLGALKNFVELQDSGKYECLFFIADYHSLTETFDPKDKSAQIMGLAEDFLAAGLDPKKSTIFLQSAVPAHTELAWMLNTITPFGELKRMTQFKDKSEAEPQNINAGLFSYPVLMAADIILYDANFVPVGDDQVQHLELARTVARKFNGRFGKTFVEPKPILTEVPRLMSLDDPKKKMSKSRPAGCLFIDDSPNEIRSKFKTAVTDSGREVKFDIAKKPAVSNLLLIYSALSGKSINLIEQNYAGKGYADFKNDLAEVVIDSLADFQKRKREFAGDTKSVRKYVEDGNKKAQKIADKKISEVKERMGLVL